MNFSFNFRITRHLLHLPAPILCLHRCSPRTPLNDLYRPLKPPIILAITWVWSICNGLWLWPPRWPRFVAQHHWDTLRCKFIQCDTTVVIQRGNSQCDSVQQLEGVSLMDFKSSKRHYYRPWIMISVHRWNNNIDVRFSPSFRWSVCALFLSTLRFMHTNGAYPILQIQFSAAGARSVDGSSHMCELITIGRLHSSSRQSSALQPSVVDFSGWKIRVIDASEQGPLKTLSRTTDDYWYLLRPNDLKQWHLKSC
jgi:hypothetical protein